MLAVLKGFVFHKIETIQHNKLVTVVPREKQIDLPDARANKLVESILSSYQGEGNMAYARILPASWFDTKTKQYTSGELDFYKYSRDALAQLQNEMSKEPASTGGFLTIIDYLIDETPNLMVVLIKNAKGIGINDELDLEEIDTLDIDKLHFAANIDLARWATHDEDDNSPHVSFLKGKSRKDTVVGYFKTFLGIDENAYLDPSKHTQQLVAAIKNYCELYKSEDEALASRRAIQEWADIKIANNEPITLNEVANQLEPGDPKNFINYLTEHKIEIPSEFEPVSKYLKQLIKYRVAGPNKEYTLSFEQTALENKTIYLNADENLVITKIPEHIKAAIPKF
ncbi:nucleoid-associated protein [Pseudomonas putida]|uniref:nucleoid-associated protein n=1 Tax=Pseudomonas putida TaxID=303 RepID=UPI002364158E|nr:nucleoid-associated protein [Pseudomonas putida]MDD1966831.1 nucleoid-associated protein [Pseudomonas putida]